jgi:glycosyltransferase involved in cell wall biosynthesis
MQVIFVARRYWPAIGGVETFMRHLALDLGSRHDVTVLAARIDDGPTTLLTDSLRPPPSFEPFSDGPVRVQPLRIPVARLALLAPLYMQVVPGLRRYAFGRLRIGAAALYSRVVAPLIADRIRNADVVHMWGGDFLAAAAVRAGRIRGVPVVVTPFAHRHAWGDDRASARSYRSASRVISLLDTEAGWYRELGVPANQIEVLGVCSPGVSAGGGAAIRERYQIHGPLILYLGVRRSYKGFDLLLSAAQRVAAQRPGVTFAFLGPGPALPSNGSIARIIDIGTVGDEDRAAWLDAADLLSLPSDSEILPGSFLEAWSVRKPVVTSNIPTLTELICKTGGGLNVPRHPEALASAILGLLADPCKLRALGEAGYRYWASHYTVPSVAEHHEHLYAAVARPNRPGLQRLEAT